MASSSGDSGEGAPRVLICGQPKAGKTSILKVVFHKMSPHETLFLESSPKVEGCFINRNALMKFHVYDFPGKVQFNDSADPADPMLFSKAGAVIFVLDAQDEPYTDALNHAKKLIEYTHKINPKVTFDILVHKADGDQFYSDDAKTEIVRDLQFRLTEDLALPDKADLPIFYTCTSIYDHSVFEAMSKVVQRLIPQQLPILEKCLDTLANSSRMEKAYIFDVVSKVYIASDSQPVDLQSYELCSDMIDVTIDITCIYGNEGRMASMMNASSDASCVISLNSGKLLYLKEVDRCLAVVCILREENFDRQQLLDHNIAAFKKALLEIFDAKNAPSLCV